MKIQPVLALSSFTLLLLTAFLDPHIYSVKDCVTCNLSVFTHKDSPQGFLIQNSGVYECWEKDLPLVKDDLVREHQNELVIFCFMSPDGMHPPALRELADIMVRSLIVISERS